MVFYYLKPYYMKMGVGFAIKFIGTLMDLCLPWILAYMIDTVIPMNRRDQIFVWGFLMILCSFFAVSFNIIANRMASKVASDATEVIRADLFEKVMYLSNRQVDRLTKPSLISRLTTDTYHVHQMLGRMQRLGVRAPILLIGGLAVTMTLDPVLSFVLFCTLPLLALVVAVVSKRSIPMFSKLQVSVDRFVRLVREDIAGIRVIKALSKGNYEKERFDFANREVVDRERKASVVNAIINPSMNILLNLGLVTVIIVGAYRVNAGTTEVGKILAFMTYFTIILHAMMSISRMFIIYSKAAVSAERIVQVLEAEDDAVLAEMGEIHDGACLEFDHVSFSYDKVENNLTDIKFRLKKGETLGIIGATGSGKSTIANLMMRFYDVDQGAVYVDGKEIRSIPLQELRRKFGVVFQQDVLFEGSILENIDLGRGISKERVMEAAIHARARAVVEEKGGIDQELNIRGANLSGGQKQRILIARALAAQPEFLILDDSSSALDYKTDAALRKELREHYADTTCVIIAQRISSIMWADHIMVLEDGAMIGYGTHEELMKSCETYREIGVSQMGDGYDC